MKRFAIAVTLIFIVFTLGCNIGCDPKNWPPLSPANSPITGFEPSASFSTNDWTYVYESEGDARVPGDTGKKIRSGSGRIGTAHLIKEGTFELPFNLFAIKAPADTYVESQFEVLYFDDQRTQICAVEEKGDKIALIQGRMSANEGMSMSYAFLHPGARVRCAEHVYELHADGWYLNGSLVYAFSAKSSSGGQ